MTDHVRLSREPEVPPNLTRSRRLRNPGCIPVAIASSDTDPCDVHEPPAVFLQLVLRFERDTVSGLILTADGRERPFCGWLGLISALDREAPSDHGGAPDV